MFARSVRSAVLVDFDNVTGLIDGARRIESWVSWLEDGQFDPKRRRRKLVEKRVYWNSHNEVHRPAFESAGFQAFNCPSRIHSKKSAADMLIALEALEIAVDNPKIAEFIILTTDIDFVPLLEKLAAINKDTVIVANQEHRVAFGVYQVHADIAIPAYVFRDAPRYVRQKTGFWGKPAAEIRAPAASARPAPKVAEKKEAVSGSRTDSRADADAVRSLKRRAADAIVALGVETNGQRVGLKSLQRAVTQELGEELAKVQKSPGVNGFKNFLKELAALDQRIWVRQATRGGLHVSIRSVDGSSPAQPA